MRKTARVMERRKLLELVIEVCAILPVLTALLGCQGLSASKSSALVTGDLGLSSSTVTFGSVVVGKTSTENITANNSGIGSLTISGAKSSSPQFSIASPSLPLTIAAGQGAKLTVSFTPSAAMPSNGTISLTSDASDSAVSLTLSGTGITAGQLSSNPASVNIVNVEVGETQSQSATLTNSGGTSVTVSQTTVTGAGFSLSGLSLPLNLGAGQSATFNVVFAPQSAGNFSGNIVFASNASNSTMNLPLSGEALAPGALTPSPTALSFAGVQIGNSQQQSVTLTNTNGGSVEILQAVATGSGFLLTSPTLPVTLPPGQGVSVTITFAPQSPGTASGSATFTSNGPTPTITVPLTGTAVSPTPPIPATFLGLNVNDAAVTGQVVWPSFPFGSARMWGIDTTWADLEQTQGSYTWSPLDNWINKAQSEGLTNFLYTFGKGTPSFYSSNPTDPTCTKAGSPVNTNGQCWPPSDVDSGDQSFKNFVSAIVQHMAQHFPNVTMAWECINEPDIPEEWMGTTAQTLTMCTDMYAIVKNNNSTALVTTPAPVNLSSTSDAANWMTGYLQAGGGKVADVIAFHGYFGPPLTAIAPETINGIAQGIGAAASSNGAASMPLWDTEMGYRDSDLADLDMEAAFVARVYLLQWSVGVSRFYWFQYGATDIGTLTTSAGGENEAGTAYAVVLGWMVGSTLPSPCSANGNVWTCNFTNASGAQTQVVWDASQSCSNGNCTTSSYTPSSTYTQYMDLAGNVHTFTAGSAVQIGAKPILLEP